MMKHLQKLGKAMMLPVACLPICGILMGLGYALAPAFMGAAGATEGFRYVLGAFLIKAGAALIDNMCWLFAVGIAVGLAKDGNGTAGLAGLVSFLMVKTLVATDVVKLILPFMTENANNVAAYDKVATNTFIGILCGIVGGVCYNIFQDTKLPAFLAFFSGKRLVPGSVLRSDFRMARPVQRTDFSGQGHCQPGCSGRRSVCLPEPSADPLRPAPRS